MLHSTRQRLVRQRTMLVNSLRSHLAEFGRIAPTGIEKLDKLRALAVEETLPSQARTVWAVLAKQQTFHSTRWSAPQAGLARQEDVCVTA